LHDLSEKIVFSQFEFVTYSCNSYISDKKISMSKTILWLVPMLSLRIQNLLLDESSYKKHETNFYRFSKEKELILGYLYHMLQHVVICSYHSSYLFQRVWMSRSYDRSMLEHVGVYNATNLLKRKEICEKSIFIMIKDKYYQDLFSEI